MNGRGAENRSWFDRLTTNGKAGSPRTEKQAHHEREKQAHHELFFKTANSKKEYARNAGCIAADRDYMPSAPWS